MTYNYDTLNKIQLTYLADKFGALVKGNGKTAMVDALIERDLDPEVIKGALKLREEQIDSEHPNHQEPLIKKDDDVQLVRMHRANPSFQYRGFKFTSEHPYVLMGKHDCNDLLRMETGFVIASPEEANEFYGRN